MKKNMRSIMAGLAGLVASAALAQASWITNLNEWVTIGNPGNDAQDSTNRGHTRTGGDGYGAVDYTYQISKFAVRGVDWNLFIDDPDSNKIQTGEIAWSKARTGNLPTTHNTFHQAAQYANWLTTGDATLGAYTIGTEGETQGRVIAIDRTFRNEAGLLYVLPSEDEWFKAAYYNHSLENPTRSMPTAATTSTARRPYQTMTRTDGVILLPSVPPGTFIWGLPNRTARSI